MEKPKFERDHSTLDTTPSDELEVMDQYEMPVQLVSDKSPEASEQIDEGEAK